MLTTREIYFPIFVTDPAQVTVFRDGGAVVKGAEVLCTPRGGVVVTLENPGVYRLRATDRNGNTGIVDLDMSMAVSSSALQQMIEQAIASQMSSSTGEPVAIAGPRGPEGPQGEAGPQGPEGARGIDGVGLSGAQGVQGDRGPTGLQGLTGEQGPAGPRGLTGDTGLRGEQGLQGLKGDQGLQGLQGPAGPGGAQGARGVQGEQGVAGVRGDAGPQGLIGVQGERGLQGLTGLTGPTGPQGERGLTGERGSDANVSIRRGVASVPAVTSVLGSATVDVAVTWNVPMPSTNYYCMPMVEVNALSLIGKTTVSLKPGTKTAVGATFSVTTTAVLASGSAVVDVIAYAPN